MNKLQELLEKRLQALQSDIESGAFKNQDELEQEVARLNNILMSSAVISGVKKADASDYIQEHFVSKAKEAYAKYEVAKTATFKAPDDYHFAERQTEIEALISSGNFDEAKEQIDNMLEMLNDETIVKDSIADGTFTQADVDYFKSIVPTLDAMIEKSKAEQPQEKGFFGRLTSGLAYVITGKNPYDNQTIKVKKEKVTLGQRFEKFKESAKEIGKKHKGKIALATAAALLIGGIALGSHLHNKADEPESTSYSQSADDQVVMATFEVTEDQVFNVNDQETHVENLQLLAQAFMERGVPVVSEEECMRLGNEGKLAVTPQQLDNWYISINLEEMDDLTFTKLLADSDTDKEELSSDFTRVNNILGSIYTTTEENPFIYQFIGNKEYSEYIKAYEEAIIKNQKGEKDDLVTLIKSRVMNPVAATSSGGIGMLSTSLIYQQANVYNASVIGQDIMNLYNINNDCREETATTFYSDDWAELMRKVNSKFDAAIAFTGSEVETYEDYLKTLTDVQDDNKVYIEDQVLPYLQKENIELGEWDIIDEVENNREVRQQSSGGGNTTIKAPQTTSTTTVTEVPKAPETEEEKSVQEQVEAELQEKNEESFQNTVGDFAQNNGGTVTENKDGDLVIQIPEQEDIIVDADTMGAYNPEKDYTGPVYDDYKDYVDKHEDDKGVDVEHIEDVGTVIVTDESDIKITNPNVYEDKNGVIRDKVTGDRVTIGTEEEIDEILEENQNLGEWITVDEGEIHYSDVDDELKITTTNPTLGDVSYTVTTPEPAPIVTPGISNNTGSSNEVSTESQIPSGVDEDIYNSLTPEEQAMLEEFLNAGETPVAGEVVEETFSDVVYGNYTVPQLMNNPSLCQYIPENILKNDFPEIWQVYQNWLEQQRIEAEQVAVEQATAIQDQVSVASAEETAVISDTAAQLAALAAAKAELIGEQTTVVEENSKQM